MNEDLILPFERKLNTHSDPELLGLYLSGKLDVVKLSDKLQEKLIRLEQCRDLYYRLRSRPKVIQEMLRCTWRTAAGDAYKISKPQAYRDFDEMTELFNATISLSSMRFHLDILLNNINETRSKALADQDWQTAAACDKNYAAVIEKFFGDGESEEYRKLQPANIMTDFLPEESKVKLGKNWEQQVQQLIKKKRKRNLQIEDAEIIDEYEHPGDAGEQEDTP